MDIFITTGVSENKGKPDFDEFLVDWVKVEQRTAAHIDGTEAICNEDEYAYFLGDEISPNLINGWKVSPNLEIIETYQNGVKVRAVKNVSPSGAGWVEVNYSSEHSFFGHNIRKKITVGIPSVPEITTQISCNSLSLSLSGYSPENSYQWEVSGTGTFSPYIYGAGENVDIPFSNSGQSVTINYSLDVENNCGVNTFTKQEEFVPCRKTRQLKIFPNPASEIVKVRLENFAPEEINESLTLCVADEAQNIIKCRPVHQLTEEFDLTDLMQGFYYFFVNPGQKEIVSEKLLIQRQ
jgi:hypothetical protein